MRGRRLKLVASLFARRTIERGVKLEEWRNKNII